MAQKKTVAHNPNTGSGKPGVEGTTTRPGFREPANKGAKAMKKKKGSKKK